MQQPSCMACEEVSITSIGMLVTPRVKQRHLRSSMQGHQKKRMCDCYHNRLRSANVHSWRRRCCRLRDICLSGLGVLQCTAIRCDVTQTTATCQLFVQGSHAAPVREWCTCVSVRCVKLHHARHARGAGIAYRRSYAVGSNRQDQAKPAQPAMAIAWCWFMTPPPPSHNTPP